jgi:hypothetical protein
MAVLYADRLTAGEREALSALPTLYDDGHFMLTRVHHPVAELSSTY